MNIRRSITLTLKVLLLTAILFGLLVTLFTAVGVADDPSLTTESAVAAGQAAAPVDAAPGADPDQARTALVILFVCLLQTIALSVAILRSRWAGVKLIAAMVFVVFLTNSVLGQLEALFFLDNMSRALIGKTVLAGGLLAAAICFIAVWVLGRGRTDAVQPSASPVGPYSLRDWVLIVLGLAVLHAVLYFVFGYYVAWQSPELRAFYGGDDPGSFLAQMADVITGSPWLLPFQILRGVLWGLVAVVLASSLRGSPTNAALVAATVFIAFFSLPLLFPNPAMPDLARQVHLVETALSRGLYGSLAVWVLRTPIRRRVAQAGST